LSRHAEPEVSTQPSSEDDKATAECGNGRPFATTSTSILNNDVDDADADADADAASAAATACVLSVYVTFSSSCADEKCDKRLVRYMTTRKADVRPSLSDAK